MKKIKIILKKKKTHRYREQTWGGQGGGGMGEERIVSLGLAEANYYTQDGLTTRAYCIAQGTILNTL